MHHTAHRGKSFATAHGMRRLLACGDQHAVWWGPRGGGGGAPNGGVTQVGKPAGVAAPCGCVVGLELDVYLVM